MIAVLSVAMEVIVLHAFGQVEAARQMFASAVRLGDGDAGGLGPHSRLQELTVALEAAVLVGSRTETEIIRPWLRPAARTFVPNGGVCVGRVLGMAALACGELTEARACYEQGLAGATKMRHRPEIALTRLQMAELCLAEAQDATGEQADALRREALEDLELAIPEFREMKMQPALERALSLMERVKA